MFKNYLKIALRNLARHKSYSFINIFGLAVGVFSCIALLLYVQDELSYDKFHNKAENLYRVTFSATQEGVTNNFASSFLPAAPLLQRKFSAIKEYVRVFPFSAVVSKDDSHRFQENKFFFADNNFFNLFNFEFIYGSPATAFNKKNNLIITEGISKKYFGEGNSVGKILRIENQSDFTISAVIKNIPHNSHFHFEFLADIQNLKDFQIIEDFNNRKSWYYPTIYSYIHLTDPGLRTDMEKYFPEILKQNLSESEAIGRNIHLQKMTDIHLYSNLEDEIEPTGSITYVIIFTIAAFFILLIACVNFINLSTARSITRSKEVGLRKVIGAARNSLIYQFILEFALYAVFATGLALLMLEFSLPYINELTGKDIEADYFNNVFLIAGLPALLLFIILAAGSYPAIYLTRFIPIEALKQKFALGKSGSLRSTLVVFQFVISVIILFSVFVIYQQLEFIKNQRIGFNKEHVVVVPLKDGPLQDNFETIKNRITSLEGIKNATALSNFPWEKGYYNFRVSAEGSDVKDQVLPTLIVSYDFVKTFGCELLEGRDFNKEYGTDASGFILNESAVKKFGWKNGLDKNVVMKDISEEGIKGKVIGVIKDFNMKSMYNKIEPLVIVVSPKTYFLDNLVVRISGKDIPEELAKIENTWDELAPDRPFEYFFLDDAFDKLYNNEQRLAVVFNYFFGIAIVISCMGLFGLVSFVTERRKKEIGIRKVLGASSPGIVFMLSKDFLKLVLIADLIAIPLALYGMNEWLSNFAYKIDIDAGVVILVVFISFTIAAITLSLQSVKASLANPVKSLKYE